MGIRGGNPPMRPDQALQTLSRAGTGPAPQQNIVFATKVIVSGPNGGEFVYNATRTVLESSNTGSATTDPILGIACPQGFATYNSSGKVINLLSTANNAFFQYNDAGAVQGQYILAVASTAGNDPVGGVHYGAGLTGLDPVFGDTFYGVGGNIQLNVGAFTQASFIRINQESVGVIGPYLEVISPQQNTAGGNGLLIERFYGDKHDGTILASTHTWRDINDGNVHPATLGVCGNIVPLLSGTAVPGTLEVWNTLPLAAGWTQNAGHTACQYRLLASPANCIQIKGDANHASFSGASSISTALPAAYIPTVLKDSDFQVDTAGQQPHYELDTTGVFSIQQAGAGTTRVVFNEIFSLES